jgi:hypothetical protein
LSGALPFHRQYPSASARRKRLLLEHVKDVETFPKARFLGGLDYAAVAQRIRRTKSTYNPIAARRLITTMLSV